ncbi:MAG TPA: LysR family transcriptional regulator, partial [Acidimicrobiales bacterium]|nr:LysR family transcriptional regulator [Acidimicrobiales bacterium]
MDLRQLEYVVAVAEEGGFTAAAAAVNVAQPSLSQSVRALEAELGVELFHRVGRGVVLSAAGDAFVSAARQVRRGVAELRDSVAAVRDVVAGTLDVAALPTLAVDPLAPLVGTFRRLHPGVIVRLVDPGDTGPAAYVRRGDAEIGMVELPVAGDLVTLPLGQQQLLAICSKGDGAGLGRVAPLSALAALPLVATPVGTSTRRVLDSALAAAGVEGRVAVEVDQREAVVPLVLAGAGISFVPAAQASGAALQGACVVRPDPPLQRSIGLVHRDRRLSPAARAFV